MNNILEKNIQTIVQAIAIAGASSVTVEYAGSGDSGDCFNCNIAWPGEPGQHPGVITLLIENLVRDDSESKIRYLPVAVERTSDFDSAIQDVTWQAVSFAGHDGWENEDGGGGSFVVYADGRAELEHYDNIVEAIYDYRTFGKAQDDAGSEKSE